MLIACSFERGQSAKVTEKSSGKEVTNIFNMNLIPGCVADILLKQPVHA
jgi:hypothetical protein